MPGGGGYAERALVAAAAKAARAAEDRTTADALDARLARWDAAQRAFLDARPDDVLAETERPPAV